MRHRNGLWFGLAAIACLLSILVSCSKPVTPPLRVGTITWLGYEPLYLAQELNFYGDAPVQIINYPSATEVSRAFRNGELEVAALTLDETILLKQNEPNMRAFLVTDVSNGADVLLAKPGIPDLPSLKGKRVGAETTALGAYILTRALEKAGLSLSDIEVVSLVASEHERAFEQNQVDAIVTFEPIRSALLKAGATVLFDSREIPNEIVDVLAARQDLIESQFNTIQALTQGWFRTLDYLKQNPDDATRRMAIRQDVPPEDFAAALKLIHIPDLTENQKLLSNVDPSLYDGIQHLHQVMLEQKLLPQAISTDGLFTDLAVKRS